MTPDAPLERPAACEFCDRPFGRFVMVYRWHELQGSSLEHLWVCRHCRGWLLRMERWMARVFQEGPAKRGEPSSDGLGVGGPTEEAE